MSYELLSDPIKRFIRLKNWDSLTAIQKAAIPRILETDSHYILSSRTASGKTEAAFLPILSQVNFQDKGIQVLYISPLIALINDQFVRIEEICHYLDVDITKWHGEAKVSLKSKLAKDPKGIVLITPESLEAMFVNKPFLVNALFSNLKFIVIDEIHSFMGSDRGVQLKSLLYRLKLINSARYRVVGLSATIGDYTQVKSFVGEPENTKVILNKTKKDIIVNYKYFLMETNDLSVAMLQDLYITTASQKVLIFPNSRGKAEEVAVKLKRIAEMEGGHSNYFSHHSSVDKEVRENIELFAKDNKYYPFCISCTSTLELGIDIGSVDDVVQIDATHSIASLIQRIGRSGRRAGKKSTLFLYSSNQWSLLQSLACWLLYMDGFIEPPDNSVRPYDILLHQTLSIVKEKGGVDYRVLINLLKNNTAFQQIESSEMEAIIAHMVTLDLLEKLRYELIIGIEGEKIVNDRNFYSSFKVEALFKVVHQGNKIGEVMESIQLKVDENIMLAARIWKIKYIDHLSKIVEVMPAKNGRKPVYSGGAGLIHERVGEMMLEILKKGYNYDFLNEACKKELEILRREFHCFHFSENIYERPLLIREKTHLFYTFTGSKINRTLLILLKNAGIKSELNLSQSCIEISHPIENFIVQWQSLLLIKNYVDAILNQFIKQSPHAIDFSKWGVYLPDDFKIVLLKERYFDFEATFEYIENTVLLCSEDKS